MQHVLAKTVVFLREPNPILVRELKQFVRNRLLLYFMLSYLAVVSLVTIAVLATPGLITGIHFLFFSFSECNGQELYAFLMMSYYFFTSAFLVLFGGIKLGFERYRNDLGYYTTVAPWRIISGKFLLGVVVSLIFLSLLTPFLTIAYMMRGLDLSSIVIAVLFYFLMSLVHYSVTITFFAGARTLTRIYLFGLILAAMQFVGFFIGYAASYLFVYYSEFIGTQFYYVMIPYSIQWAFILFPLPLAVCQVSPESSNRMTPMRICMTLFYVFIVTLITFRIFYGGFATIIPEYIEALGTVSAVAMTCIFIFYPILFLVFICEREKYSIRQRRAVPRNGTLRLLYFLHATGVSNAVLWYFLFMITNLWLIICWYCLVGTSSGVHNWWEDTVKNVFWRLVPFGMMVFCWATALYLFWKLQLKRILPREWLSFPLLGLGIIVFIFYCICEAVMPYDSSNMVSVMFSVFPIVVFGDTGVMMQYFFGIVGTLVCMAMLGEQIATACGALAPYDGPKILTEAQLQETVEELKVKS